MMTAVRRFRSTRWAVLLFLVACVAPVSAGDFQTEFAYLYLDANEGQAAGGHAAIRFGDEVYHFEFADGGLLRAARETFEPFRVLYTEIENRTLHLSRIAVSHDTYAVLRRRFAERFESQTAAMAEFERLRRDRELLEVLARSPAELRLEIPGLGLFEPDGSVRHEDPGLAELRELAMARHGAERLARNAASIRRAIEVLDPNSAIAAQTGSASWRYSFADRYHDLHAWLEVYALVRRAAPLRRGVYRVFPEIALNPSESAALSRLREQLRESIVTALGNPRPDQGSGLLVALARLQALDKSLKYGRFVFLDTLTDAAVEELPWQRAAPFFLAAYREFRELRRDLAETTSASELTYALLENAANRLGVTRAALKWKVPFRMFAAEIWLPRQPAPPRQIVIPHRSRADFRQAAERLRQRQQAEARRLEQTYHYGLLTRNCVTEIFRTLEDGVEGHERERLGGRVTRSPFNAIPFVSARNVEAQYRLLDSFDFPSRRARYLSGLGAMARWAELTSFTSAIYRPNSEDSFFVFFTDQPVWARPLFGAVNLAAGGVEALVGFVLVPFDSGRTLRAGLRGVFVSLPELVFFNIRKGTFPLAIRQ